MFKHYKNDIPASLAVFVVAIPLCLGIAHASGAPLVSGLLAGIIGGVITGSISNSNLSVSGPAAGLTTIVLAGIATLGSFGMFLTAVLLAGVLQLVLGYFKLGKLAGYFPGNVIKGMLAAIGLILIVKQFPHLIGYDIEEMGVTEFNISDGDINEKYHEPLTQHENTLSLLFHSVKHLNYYVFSIGFGSLILLFIWDKWLALRLPALPGSLVVVFLGIFSGFAINYLHVIDPLELDHFVQVPKFNGLGELTSIFVFPDLKALYQPFTYKLAITLAVVASLESLLSIEAIQKLDEDKQEVDSNRELLAQGGGNILSGLLGGLPITAVIVRGSVNIAAGAKSKLSAILHGLFIILAIVFFADILNLIPLASLAAILCFTGYKLIKPELVIAIYKQGWRRFLPFIVTLAAIFLTDLLIGVTIGLCVSLLFILMENSAAAILHTERQGFKKRIVLDDNLYFLHKPKVAQELRVEPGITVVEIDGRKATYIDHDIIELLKDFKASLLQQDIKVIIGGIKEMENKEDIGKQLQSSYEKLFKNNKNWVEEKLHKDPAYFQKLTAGQSPEYLFIGCSDSRVPANEITGSDPGEMFVHRNIANVVVNTDMNIMSVLQYSVEVLNVKHIIVCGHYGCGGIKAAMEDKYHGLIDKWLRNIKDAYRIHKHEFEGLTTEDEVHRKLVEVNVREQVYNVLKTSFVQRNKALYGFPQVHGWVYDISDGYIKDLDIDLGKEFPDYNIYKIEEKQ